MYDRRLLRDLCVGPVVRDEEMCSHSGRGINGAITHLRDVPRLGRGAVVHTLDDIPPVRAAVEDAGPLVWVAGVEAAQGRIRNRESV